MEAETKVCPEPSTSWTRLLRLAHEKDRAGTEDLRAPGARTAEDLWILDLYGPLCRPRAQVVAHLGQSLDGRIATGNGVSKWVTGTADVIHNHRMRALYDAVLVGAGTIRHDDPQLTVRKVAGPSPVRVVVDPERRLGLDYAIFQDGAAPTLLLAEARRVAGSEWHGQARVVGIEAGANGLDPQAILATLRAQGLGRVFIEGGGVTVSRFLRAGCLDRLQLTIAPLIIGSGRTGLELGAIDCLEQAIRPRVRRFELGDDLLFECVFRDPDG